MLLFELFESNSSKFKYIEVDVILNILNSLDFITS